MTSQATLLKALEKPYDYLTARSTLNEVLGRADLEKKDAYSAAEIGRFLVALKAHEKRADRVGKVAAELGASEAPAAHAAPPAKKAHVVEAPAAEEAPAADAAPDAEAAPAAEASSDEASAEEPAADEAPKADQGKKKKK